MKNFILLCLVITTYSCSNSNKVVDENKRKEVIKLLEGYRELVVKGASMDSLARLYSEDPGTVSNGGRYDSITRGMMVPEFDSVVFTLKPGDISEVFETKYGFHFVQIISSNGTYVNARHIILTPKD